MTYCEVDKYETSGCMSRKGNECRMVIAPFTVMSLHKTLAWFRSNLYTDHHHSPTSALGKG